MYAWVSTAYSPEKLNIELQAEDTNTKYAIFNPNVVELEKKVISILKTEQVSFKA